MEDKIDQTEQTLANKIDNIIQKFLEKGFGSLSEEDLAFSLISQQFWSRYNQVTGKQWNKEFTYDIKMQLCRSSIHFQELNTTMNQSIFSQVSKSDIAKYRTDHQQINESSILKAVISANSGSLHIAAKEGHTALLDLLIQKGYQIDQRDEIGRTSLHLACLNGNENSMVLLLESGANIYLKDQQGRNCLHFAVLSNNININKFLMEHYSYLIHDKDTNGQLPYHYLAKCYSQYINEILDIYIKNQINILGAQDNEGNTLLHLAAMQGNKKVVEILLNNTSIDKYMKNNNEQIAVELACGQDIKDILSPQIKLNLNLREQELKYSNLFNKQQYLEEEINYVKSKSVRFNEQVTDNYITTKQKEYLQKQYIEPIIGELKIQIPKAEKINLEQAPSDQIYFKIILLGATTPIHIKQYIYKQQGRLKFVAVIPLIYILKENLSDVLTIQLYKSWQLDVEQDFIGEINVQWKECLDDPEEFKINQYEKLQNLSFKEKRLENTVKGYIGIQVKYISIKSQHFRSHIPDIDFIGQTKLFQAPIDIKGFLQIGLVCAIPLINIADLTNIIAEIYLPNKTMITVKPRLIDEDGTIDTCKTILITLLNKKTDQFKGAVIGECYVDWSQCLTYYINEYHQQQLFIMTFQGTQTRSFKLYFKVRFIPEKDNNYIEQFEFETSKNE